MVSFSSSLSDTARDTMVKDMTKEELEDIVKSCAHNKSPGWA